MASGLALKLAAMEVATVVRKGYHNKTCANIKTSVNKGANYENAYVIVRFTVVDGLYATDGTTAGG